MWHTHKDMGRGTVRKCASQQVSQGGGDLQLAAVKHEHEKSADKGEGEVNEQQRRSGGPAKGEEEGTGGWWW